MKRIEREIDRTEAIQKIGSEAVERFELGLYHCFKAREEPFHIENVVFYLCGDGDIVVSHREKDGQDHFHIKR